MGRFTKLAQFNGASKAEDLTFKELMEADKKQLQIHEEIVHENEKERLAIVEILQIKYNVFKNCF